MAKYFIVFIVIHVFCSFIVFAEDADYEGLTKPNIAQDEQNNHILMVTVQKREHNRVMDTNKDEVIIGLSVNDYPLLNEELCNYLAKILDIKQLKSIEVIKGVSENKGKKVQIDGTVITADEISERILNAVKEFKEEQRQLRAKIINKPLRLFFNKFI